MQDPPTSKVKPEPKKMSVQEYIEDKQKKHGQKIKDFKQEIRDILTGKHSGYKHSIEILQMEYEEAIEKAEMFFEYQVECAEQIYELEKNHSTQEFKNDYEGLQGEMLERLEEKKRKLQDEYDNFDLDHPGDLKVIGTRKATRLAVKTDDKRERKNKKQQGATLVFALNENDVYDDLQYSQNKIPKFYGGRR